MAKANPPKKKAASSAAKKSPAALKLKAKPKAKKVEKRVEKKNEKKPEKKVAPAKKAAKEVKKVVVTKAQPKKTEKKLSKKAEKIVSKKGAEKKLPKKAELKKSQVKEVEKKKLDKKAGAASVKEKSKEKDKKKKEVVEVEAAKKPGRKPKEAKEGKEKGDDDLLFDDDADGWGDDEVIIDDFETDEPKKRFEDDIRDSLVEEILALSEDHSLKDIFQAIKDVSFFDKESDECLERSCDNPVTTANYCRLHYIKNWNEIKKKKQLLADGKLQLFIEDLVSKYPVKYLEAILQDLSDDKTFYNVLKEMNIDSTEETFDDEAEVVDDDQDIAYETKTTIKGAFGEEE